MISRDCRDRLSRYASEPSVLSPEMKYARRCDHLKVSRVPGGAWRARKVANATVSPSRTRVPPRHWCLSVRRVRLVHHRTTQETKIGDLLKSLIPWRFKLLLFSAHSGDSPPLGLLDGARELSGMPMSRASDASSASGSEEGIQEVMLEKTAASSLLPAGAQPAPCRRSTSPSLTVGGMLQSMLAAIAGQGTFLKRSCPVQSTSPNMESRIGLRTVNLSGNRISKP